MASIKDAIEESTNEPQALVQYILFSLPLFGAVYFYTKGQQNTFWFYILAIISFIIMLGTMVRCANNVMNFRDKIMPSMNPFILLFDSIRTIIALLPAAALNGGIAYYLITKIYPMISVTWISQAATYITYAVSGSIVLTVFMLYAKKFSLKDAFDFKAISDSCIDVLIQVIWLTIQLIFIDAVLAGSVTYLCWLFIGIDNIVTYFVWCMTAVFNIALIGNYLGQLNYEALHQAEVKAEKKKEKEEIDALKKSNGNPPSPSTF